MKNNDNLEEILTILESNTESIKNGDLSMDETMKLYEESVKLYEKASKLINDKKQKIEIYREDLDKAVDFDEI